MLYTKSPSFKFSRFETSELVVIKALLEATVSPEGPCSPCGPVRSEVVNLVPSSKFSVKVPSLLSKVEAIPFPSLPSAPATPVTPYKPCEPVGPTGPAGPISPCGPATLSILIQAAPLKIKAPDLVCLINYKSRRWS